MAFVGSIRLLPTDIRALVFRVYNKTLKVLGSEYTGKTYFGARLYCNLNDYIQFFIFHFGVWEPEISQVIEQSLSPGDVFVDVGANIGYDALLGSHLVGPKGKVVAIEASPTTFALLKRNLALNNDFSNVRAVNVAVSDRAGKLNLFEISKYNIGLTTSVASRAGTFVASVDALPLAQVLAADEIARVRLIKMDVEGAEAVILRRFLEDLSLFPEEMDLVVEASPDDDREAWVYIFDQLRAAGFAVYEIPDEYEVKSCFEWRPGPSPPLRRIETLPTRRQDLLFTRRKDAT